MREEKQKFRAALKAKAEMADHAADEVIAEKFFGLAEYRKATCVLLYLSVGYEVDTYQIVKNALAENKRVCVPRCLGGGVMHAVEITSLEELEPGMYGILEPPKEAPMILPKQLDLILVPGMAFDRSRNRLGRGAGYYDRYLEQAPQAVTVGICRTSRLFDTVPCELHDRAVDILITEREVVEKNN